MPQFCLPFTFSSFRDEWREMWENTHVFQGRREEDTDYALYVNADAPLADIFYLVQVLSPGILQISSTYECEGLDYSETITRVLPSQEWVAQDLTQLKHILGEQRASKIVEAVKKEMLPKRHMDHFRSRFISKRSFRRFISERLSRVPFSGGSSTVVPQGSSGRRKVPRGTSNGRDSAPFLSSNVRRDYLDYLDYPDFRFCSGDHCDWCGKCTY